MIRHLAKALDWREAACGHVMTTEDSLPTTNNGKVTCPACMNIVEQRRTSAEFDQQFRRGLTPREQYRRDWTVAAVGGDTDLGFTDWLREQGVGDPTPPPHTPPRMVNGSGVTDGVFIFHDAKYGAELDVRPQTDGHVLFDIGGNMFYLHHLDRADMLRVLLYDFHYSPEKDGPNDDDDN